MKIRAKFVSTPFDIDELHWFYVEEPRIYVVAWNDKNTECQQVAIKYSTLNKALKKGGLQIVKYKKPAKKKAKRRANPSY